MYLKIKNWEQFQHYKDRCPPWIKLATDTFQNYEFSRLHDASKLLAICIWTLAARSKEGLVPYDFTYIKGQCLLGEIVQSEHLEELINQGFIEHASNALATCKQSACPETETETETNTHTMRVTREKKIDEDLKIQNPKFYEKAKILRPDLTDQELQLSYNKFLSKDYMHCTLDGWQNWIIRENKSKIPIENDSRNKIMSEEEKIIDSLGISNWARRIGKPMHAPTGNLKFLEDWENKTGKTVDWDNFPMWQKKHPNMSLHSFLNNQLNH